MNKGVIYKFQDWVNTYHRKSFLNNELYFSNNFSFNDPFDLQLPFVTEGKPKFNKELFFSEKSNYPSISIDKIPKKDLDEMWNKMLDANPQIRSANDTAMHKVVSDIENEAGILCLSKRNNSTLMWGHYANSHKGFCIGFSEIELIKFVKNKLGTKVEIFDVQYIKEIPKFNYAKALDRKYVMEFVNKRFSSKHIDWKYEKEKRIIISDFQKQLLKLPSEIYKQLIFGYNMNVTERKELTILCKELYPNIKIYEAKPSNNSFNMTIKPIE